MTICNKAKELIEAKKGVSEEFSEHCETCEICKQELKQVGTTRAPRFDFINEKKPERSSGIGRNLPRITGY